MFKTSEAVNQSRVSSETQNLDRQVEYFKELGANPRTIFQEKKSGKNFEDREVSGEGC
ncbi:recombinase family protein [Cetobacterium sp.]|uniref:recombinase family protein n=1 Tax=Cetobacterium sp. TaxID=2071632 RepID=UPI003F2AB575